MRMADGPMSTPRRPAPRSIGTPITPMLRRFLAITREASTRRDPVSTREGAGSIGRGPRGMPCSDLNERGTAQDGPADVCDAAARGRHRRDALRDPTHAAEAPQARPERAVRGRFLRRPDQMDAGPEGRVVAVARHAAR